MKGDYGTRDLIYSSTENLKNIFNCINLEKI